MAQSVLRDIYGPEWPLGLITLVTPGVPICIMKLVDPNLNIWNPDTVPSESNPRQYSVAFQQICFQGFKVGGGGAGLQDNTGNMYVIRQEGTGSKDRVDYGQMILCVKPGQTVFIASAPVNKNVYGPYRYFVDGDNASDSLLVTGYIG